MTSAALGYSVLAVIGVLALGLAISYNRFVSQRNLIRDSWANIDTELQRRHDLVPNLVETVRGYAAHERELFERVTRARADAIARVGRPATQAGVENRLAAGMRDLLAVVESYPELRASEHFLELQRELALTEDRIQVARRLYNGNVREYNQRVESVPSNLIAAVGGFRRHEYFELDPAIRDAEPPRVET